MRLMKSKLRIYLGIFIFVCIILFVLKNQLGINKITSDEIASDQTVSDELLIWEEIKTMTVEHSAYYAGFYNENLGVTAGYHGATYVTKDGGEHWNPAINEANCRYGLDFLDETTFWTVGNYGGNRVSTDGGAKLFAVTDLPLIENYPNNLVCILSETDSVVGAPLRLAYTQDGGKSWVDYSLPITDEWLMGMRFITIDEGVVLTERGELYETKTRGEKWSKIATLPVVKGIRYSEAATVAMHYDPDGITTIVYLDQDDHLYGFQLDQEKKWRQISIEKSDSDASPHFESVPYLSPDGTLLTTVDMLGNIKLYRLKR